MEMKARKGSHELQQSTVASIDSLVFVVMCIVFLLFPQIDAHMHADYADKPGGIYVFGASYLDVGNNNYLNASVAKANFPPNGIDFPGGVATGRFSNGLLVDDLIAQSLGFQLSPPPFLAPFTRRYAATGINFASAGSGILNSTGVGSIPLDSQITNFEIVLSSLREKVGPKHADAFISRSMFMFYHGNNDITAFAPQLANATRSNDTAAAGNFVATLSGRFKSQLTRLYGLGARKFAFFGTGVTGCLPYVRERIPGGGCYEGLNRVSQLFNQATVNLLRDMKSSLAGFSYSFADTYDLVYQIRAKASQNGFKEVDVPCCPAIPCTEATPICANRREYFFWDLIHPTQAVYEIFARTAFLGNPPLVAPVNFRQLMYTSR